MNTKKYINKINIFTFLYLVLSLFLLSYTVYRAEYIHEGDQLSYYYKYYLIFFFGSVFWLLVMFLNIKTKLKIILFATSLISLMYFYELIRFYEPIIKEFKIIQFFNKSDIIKNDTIKGSKYEIIQKLKEKGDMHVFPSVFPKAFLNKKFNDSEEKILPLGGISNATTVFCKEGEKFSIYKSDRYGFNNLDYVWDENKIEWFLVGDSFTQGACVKQEENFASRINFLTKQNVINVGMSGNGPLSAFASLKEYAFYKQPNKILWFYFERNDLDDLNLEKSNNILSNYLNDGFSQDLYNNQDLIDKKLKQYVLQAETNYHKNKKIKKLFSFSKIIRLQIIRDKISLDRGLDLPLDPTLKKILNKSNNLVKSWGGTLYFIYLPDKERYFLNDKNDKNYLQRLKVLKLVKSMDIPIIDVHEDFFMKHADPLSFFADRIYGHYSPNGYKKISKMIVSQIVKN